MSEGPAKPKARDLNQVIRYTMWSVFHLRDVIGDGDRAAEANEVEKLFETLAAEDVTIRGLYDVSGLRADAELMIWWHAETAEQGVVVRGLYDVAGLRGDADVMVWWHAATIEQLQAAYHGLLRTEVGQHLEPVWSNAALHRPAEFNKSHIPAFMADEQARRYVCVYPFVRSYEWYPVSYTHLTLPTKA